MSLTKLQIFNLALARIGHKAAVSDPSEASFEAERIRAVYDHARDAVLRDHSWSFATIYTALSLSGETQSIWEYQYRYPAICLNFIEIKRASVDADRIPFEISLSEDRAYRVILTNEPEAIGKFVAKVENEQLFDGLFGDALAWKLAKEIAPSLTASPAVTESCERSYVLALGVAKSVNNQESQTHPPRDPASIRARL